MFTFLTVPRAHSRIHRIANPEFYFHYVGALRGGVVTLISTIELFHPAIHHHEARRISITFQERCCLPADLKVLR